MDVSLDVIFIGEWSEIVRYRIAGIPDTPTEKTSQYSNVFKNLTVEEIKTFETFDKDGKIKNREEKFVRFDHLRIANGERQTQ